jgi:deazaflavin-dependent oxidoreductase (nitroreductase family)
MTSDLMFKTANAAHRVVQKLSGGRLGWQAGTMPVVELTTTGRKSGQPRTVLLTSPWQDGDTLLEVASRGGDDQHPAWFLNLRDNPEVRVAVSGKPVRPMRARVANAEERADLWPKITAEHRNYAGYQTKTEREIPLVFLEHGSAPTETAHAESGQGESASAESAKGETAQAE